MGRQCTRGVCSICPACNDCCENVASERGLRKNSALKNGLRSRVRAPSTCSLRSSSALRCFGAGFDASKRASGSITIGAALKPEPPGGQATVEPARQVRSRAERLPRRGSPTPKKRTVPIPVPSKSSSAEHLSLRQENPEPPQESPRSGPSPRSDSFNLLCVHPIQLRARHDRFQPPRCRHRPP